MKSLDQHENSKVEMNSTGSMFLWHLILKYLWLIGC